MKTMINTASGPMSPGQALETFKQAKLPAGSLLGIYTQLLESDRAAEATQFVNKNPGKFNGKIQRMAQESATSRPTGAKNITSALQAMELLQGAGPRPTMKITFRKDCPERVTNITALAPNLLEFYEPNAFMDLVHCVRMSREWQDIPRTYTITVKAASDDELRQVAEGFAAALESVELKHNLTERVAVWIGVEENELLSGRTDVFYDASVFRDVCKALGFESEAESYIRKITDPNAGMSDVIMVLPHLVRPLFLKKYFELFDTALATA
jgi:hypothetical protein